MFKKIFSKLKFFASKPAIFIYYLIFALIWTRPVILHLKSILIGHNDAWQFIWNFWWLKTAINTWQNPFFTHYLHWPNGISLLFQTINLPNSLLAYPLQSILGLAATYNLLVLLNLALVGFGTFVLTNYFAKNKFAAFVAGYLVAFSSYMIAHTYGHLNLISFGWVPLFIYFYWRMIQAKSPWYWPAIFLILIAYNDWYYFFFIGIFLLGHLIYLFIFDRKTFLKRKTLLNYFLMFGSALVVIGPYLGALIYVKTTNPDFSFLGHDPLINSVDFQTFFVPNFTSFFGDHFRTIWSAWQSNYEGIGYLGYSVLALILGAIFLIRKKETYFWFSIFLLFSILAMGPFFQYKGEIFKNIPLIYFWMAKHFSFVTLEGVPARFMAFAYLAAGVLTALMLGKIMGKRIWWRYVLVAVFSILIFIEYWPSKMITSTIPQIDFYFRLKADPEIYAIIDVSFDYDKVLYYQTIHQKPLIGGYTSRGTKKTFDFLNNTPVVNNLYFGNDFDADVDPTAAKEILKKYKIKFILISNQDKKRLKIANRLDLLLVDRNVRGVVYQVY